MAGKGKGLTIAMLGLSPKKSSSEQPDLGEDDESESDDEMPPGFVEAVSEMREAEDDESMAKALHRALQLAGAC